MKKRSQSITPEAKPWPFSVGFPLTIRDSDGALSICGVNRGPGWPLLCEVPKSEHAATDARAIVAACTDKIARHVGEDPRDAAIKQLATALQGAVNYLDAYKWGSVWTGRPHEICDEGRAALEVAKKLT